LVALCGLRWRDHLIWAATEAMHFVAVWLYVAGLSTPDRGMPPGWYAVFLFVRLVGVGYLAWRGWANAAARHPATSDADSDAVVDELAGDFTDAEDRLVVRIG